MCIGRIIAAILCIGCVMAALLYWRYYGCIILCIGYIMAELLLAGAVLFGTNEGVAPAVLPTLREALE